MNPRIKELLEEATEVYDHWHSGESHSVVDYRVFAELIVKECAKVLTQHGAYYSGNGEPYYYAASLIEEHFGVEE